VFTKQYEVVETNAVALGAFNFILLACSQQKTRKFLRAQNGKRTEWAKPRLLESWRNWSTHVEEEGYGELLACLFVLYWNSAEKHLGRQCR